MKILAIETSCDETAIALVGVQNDQTKTKFKILGNEVSSQIALHAQYGGVFPMMAKREHGKNIIGVLQKVLTEAKMFKPRKKKCDLETRKRVKILKILERENDLSERFIEFVEKIKKPKIDVVVVTTGPGLEPALWVGISFAKAISVYLDIPFVSVNHMEGHIFSIFPSDKNTFTIDSDKKIFPMLSLLVSGGHTELVLVKDWMKYKKLGKTRDDASGEAFDKVARMLGLPYPGGPEISKLAKKERIKITNEGEVSNFLSSKIILPRPMIHSKDYDFSFSGLKTAVLYLIRDLKEKNPKILEGMETKQMIAKEFEDSVVEILVYKTIKAIKEHKIKTLVVGGGVSANRFLQEIMVKNITDQELKTKIYFPSGRLTGDNALMIAIAGYFQFKNKKIVKNLNLVKANGNLSL